MGMKSVGETGLKITSAQCEYFRYTGASAELERRGVSFRVVGRSREKLERAFGKMAHAEIFPADLSGAPGAGAAASGVDTIFYCVGLPYTLHHLHRC